MMVAALFVSSSRRRVFEQGADCGAMHLGELAVPRAREHARVRADGLAEPRRREPEQLARAVNELAVR